MVVDSFEVVQYCLVYELLKPLMKDVSTGFEVHLKSALSPFY